MKYLQFFWQMLRYRVALMLILFYWLGMAVHQRLQFSVPMLIGIACLGFCYISATTLNDIADKDIDAINHRNHPGRLLVSGVATVKEMVGVHLIANLIALVLALLVGLQAAAVICLSLCVNYLYSVKPFRISYRTYYAPILLAFAYVALPYWLGVVVGRGKMDHTDILWLCSLIALFLGRIVLKDFRDRAGDKQYGKPTFLLRFGKNATCFLSGILVLLGNAVLLFLLRDQPLLLLIIVELFFAAIFYAGYLLYKAELSDAEQIAIGIGAKMGNGVLFLLLGLQLLHTYNAPVGDILVFCIFLAAIYCTAFLQLITNPQNAIIGYRG